MSDARELADRIEAYVEQTTLTSEEFETLREAWEVLDTHAEFDEDTMRCPDCDIAHSEWEDRGTCANHDGRTTLDLWECNRCGYTLEGVRL